MCIQRSTGFSSGSISEASRGIANSYHVAYGFIWFYYNEETYKDDLDNVAIKVKQKPLKKLRAKTILEVDLLDGHIIREWVSALSAHKELGYCSEAILQACNGDLKTAYGRLWVFKDIENLDSIIKEKIKATKNRSNASKINQIDITTGEIVKQWDSAKDIEKTINLKASGIRKCCNGYRKTYRGFDWEYV